MTAAEFEELDELQAELWIATRFRQFVSAGFPHTLALVLAVYPDIAVPDAPADRNETLTPTAA